MRFLVERRRGDDGRVQQRAFAQDELSLCEHRVDFIKQASGEVVRLQEAAEFEQRGGVRYALQTRINTGKGAQRVAVVEGVLQRFVSKRIPLLEKIKPQHARHAHGRAAAFAVGVVRHNERGEPLPRDDRFHLFEKSLAPGGFLFAGVFVL